jgi:hypothetical protein
MTAEQHDGRRAGLAAQRAGDGQHRTHRRGVLDVAVADLGQGAGVGKPRRAASCLVIRGCCSRVSTTCISRGTRWPGWSSSARYPSDGTKSAAAPPSPISVGW